MTAQKPARRAWNKGRSKWHLLPKLAVGQAVVLRGAAQKSIASGVHRQARVPGAKFAILSLATGVRIERTA